ncbi:hypothetical protein L209DRAFT_315742 [Thermothelomyces heterothallicus CBS 203.75]
MSTTPECRRHGTSSGQAMRERLPHGLAKWCRHGVATRCLLGPLASNFQGARSWSETRRAKKRLKENSVIYSKQLPRALSITYYGPLTFTLAGTQRYILYALFT